MKSGMKIVAGFLLAGAIYLLFWPVPIEPQAWNAPKNEGYSGDFVANNTLSKIKRIDIGADTGPEDMALGPDNRLYIPTHEGNILALDVASGTVSQFANTGGRVLGVAFGPDGTLYAADAYQGLFSIDQSGKSTLLANETGDGSQILYADGVDVTSSGIVYFSDASTKFGAKENGGTLPASLLDLMEHGLNGRIIKYDPDSQTTEIVLTELSFANGVALTKDEKHLLVVETGSYAIHKMPLDNPSASTVLISNLPGFPDNIKRNPDGTFWFGLVSPRSDPVDFLSDKPFLRKVIQRLPESFRPKPQRYGFLVRIDENGNVLETLHDPTGNYALVTGAVPGPDGRLYISSLTEPDLAVLDR